MALNSTCIFSCWSVYPPHPIAFVLDFCRCNGVCGMVFVVDTNFIWGGVSCAIIGMHISRQISMACLLHAPNENRIMHYGCIYHSGNEGWCSSHRRFGIRAMRRAEMSWYNAATMHQLGWWFAKQITMAIQILPSSLVGGVVEAIGRLLPAI